MDNRSRITHSHPKTRIYFVYILTLLVLVAASCKGGGPTGPTSAVSTPGAQTQATGPTETATPNPPTATSVPLAAKVNGVGIPLAEYQAELGQYQAALTETGKTPPPGVDQSQTVLNDLIDEALLAEAADQAGYTVSDSDLQARITQLESTMGGSAALSEWEKMNGYTDQSFQQSLARSIAAAWQRDQIVSQVPAATEQVHARQILVNTQTEADDILAQLKSGADFATLAYYYNSNTGGDLGWFPRGYLTIPEVENAAFSLEAGSYSGVIQSKLGFHIIQVIERDPNHPLSADARLVLQKQALQKWIDDRRAQSQITVLLE